MVICFLITVPLSIQAMQDQNVTEGYNLTLKCILSGIPSPTVSWIKLDGPRHHGHILEITYINRTQAGEYKCEASNECGNATETATIDVQCKYIVKFIPCYILFLVFLCHSLAICFSVNFLMERLVYL